jgi:WD40 repeat protein
VTVAGQGIVALCEDNTVNVYDGVTGVLKMSLNAPQQVTRVEGSPDGSLLFFVHQRAHEITVWDTQTGGLIYTLTTTFGSVILPFP